jgi:hypothetical protein
MKTAFRFLLVLLGLSFSASAFAYPTWNGYRTPEEACASGVHAPIDSYKMVFVSETQVACKYYINGSFQTNGYFTKSGNCEGGESFGFGGAGTSAPDSVCYGGCLFNSSSVAIVDGTWGGIYIGSNTACTGGTADSGGAQRNGGNCSNGATNYPVCDQMPSTTTSGTTTSGTTTSGTTTSGTTTSGTTTSGTTTSGTTTSGTTTSGTTTSGTTTSGTTTSGETSSGETSSGETSSGGTTTTTTTTSGTTSSGTTSNGSTTSGSVSGDCTTGIACSGDAIQCEILRIQHRQYCSENAPGALRELGETVLSGGDPLGNDLPKPSNSEEIDVAVGLDKSGFIGDGACFEDFSFNAGGQSFVLPLSDLCEPLLPLRYAVMLIASLISFRILSGSILRV